MRFDAAVLQELGFRDMAKGARVRAVVVRDGQ